LDANLDAAREGGELLRIENKLAVLPQFRLRDDGAIVGDHLQRLAMERHVLEPA
jgi:hypothetical protein